MRDELRQPTGKPLGQAVRQRGALRLPARPTFDPNSTFKTSAIPPALAAARAKPSHQSSSPRDASAQADFVILGNGIAGCVAAMEARRYAPDARIVIVTDQPHPTINTPALKHFGAGLLDLDQLLAFPAGNEQKFGIRTITRRAERIDASARVVYLSTGEAVSYRRLLLATGSAPTGLPEATPGREFDGVVTLHTLHDYLDLRRRLPFVERAVVVGGGTHAAETALLLAHQGVHVTWLVRGRTLLSSMLDQVGSDLVLAALRREQIEIRLETALGGVVGRVGTVAGVVTEGGEFLPCDLVVAAVGVRPSLDLLRGTTALSPNASRTGLPVDRKLRTHLPHVFAAGAVAAVLDPQSGDLGSRAQWYFAVQQGRLAGAVLADAAIPNGAERGALGGFWHATHLGRVGIVVAGAPLLSPRSDPDYEVIVNRGARFYRRAVLYRDRLVGYLAVGGNLPAGLALKRMIDEHMPVNALRTQLLAEEGNLQAALTEQRVLAIQDGGWEALTATVMISQNAS